MTFKVLPGQRVRDTVTGCVGLVIETCLHLGGMIQHRVQPALLNEGKPVDAYWFEESRLEKL